MGLRLIYGRAGTGKSEKCYKEISEKIKQNNKILIITPEQFSFTAEKKLMEAIETEAVFNADGTWSEKTERADAEKNKWPYTMGKRTKWRTQCKN